MSRVVNQKKKKKRWIKDKEIARFTTCKTVTIRYDTVD